jgi:ABC-2 type transport system permease protein
MKLARDTWLVFSRQMALMLRNPVWLVVGVMQPLYFLVLFGPLLAPILGGQNAYQVFVPGLLVQLAMFGPLFVGFVLISELRGGILERMRVTPVSRLALLLGRCGRDILSLLIQAAMMTALSLPFGLTVRPLNLLLAFAMLALIALLLSALGYGIALALGKEDGLAPLLNAVSMPVMLLSGILLPLTYAPGWLKAIAFWNPFSWAVDATRALFNGHPDDPHVWKALIVLGLLAAAMVTWAARLFARTAR